MKKRLKFLLNMFCIGLILLSIISSFVYYRDDMEEKGLISLGQLKLITLASCNVCPTIKSEDMAVVKVIDMEDLESGDIVVYETLYNEFILGRIEKEEDIFFIRRGFDRNEDIDLKDHGDKIIGRCFLKIPKGSYMIKFIQSPLGIALFIMIPLAILIWGESDSILKKVCKKE